MKTQSLIGIAIITVSLSLPAMANVRLPKIFTDNMMLQRDQPIRVWGWADPDEAVTVALAGKQAMAKADAKGAWAVELPAMKKGENLELTVTGKNVVTLKNVIVGDIWLCSGQSNMEMPLGLCLGAAEDIAAANFPRIRKIKINNVVSANPEEDAPTATPWQECSPSTAAGFTAVGFYFAREVQEKTGVAIGILDANYGATVIEQWMSTKGINWADPSLSASPFGKSGWGVRYNATIHPFVRLPIKGALWYQGEGNFSEGDAYYVKMRALIEGWRKQWGQGDFPFYFVQIASLHAVSTNAAGGYGWAKIREAQVKSLSITNTGMAVIIDTVPLAEAENVHPRNKYDVGHRLALWALERDYGQKQPEVSGPLSLIHI